MSHHMVIFENRDGHPGYNQFDSVEAAVSFVEDLRNNQGIEKFQIFELKEVKFELKTYYRVELQALNPAGPARPPQAAPAPGAPGPQQARPAAASPSAPPPQGGGLASGGEPKAAPSAAPPAAAPTAPSAPTAPATEQKPASASPVPPADQPKGEEEQPVRRGLFGR